MYHKLAVMGLAIFGLALLCQPVFARDKADGLATVDICDKCHKDIHAKWADSMHSQSMTDPIFQTAYMQAYLASGGAAKKICLNCHAPTVLVTGDYDLKKESTKEGITCHFCHSVTDTHPDKGTRFDLKVSSTMRGPTGGGAKNDYHDSVASPLHRKSEFCAGCHEYTANGIKIMGTYSEWKDSPYAAKGITCQGCHMPAEPIPGAGGEKGKPRVLFNHSLAGGHSIMQLRKAINVSIKAINRGKDRITVDLEVENSGSGHYVPTGIPTRKLVLYCQVRTADNKISKKSISFEKIIFDHSGKELLLDSEIMLGNGTQIVKDNRIAPGEKRKEQMVFYNSPVGNITVTAWVDYLYQPQLVQPTEMRIEMNRTEQTSAP